jgi:hypothetical protein
MWCRGENPQAAGKLTIGDVTRCQLFHRTRRQWYLAVSSILGLLFSLFGIAVV